MVECKRKNESYRQAALVSLGKFADTYEHDDLSQMVLDIMKSVVEELMADQDEMDMDTPKDREGQAVNTR